MYVYLFFFRGGGWQAALDERLSGFASTGKRLRQRQGDMDKTSKKAALDRIELQRELKDLTGRSEDDAHRATEVQYVLLLRRIQLCFVALARSPRLLDVLFFVADSVRWWEEEKSNTMQEL